MAVTIPIIVTNDDILVKRKGKNEFLTFNIEGIDQVSNVPFYHHYAKKLDDSVNIFKEFIKDEYGTMLGRPYIAVIIPDDTTELERAFLQSFFLNVGKALAISTMSQVLSCELAKYISISMTNRCIVLQYVSHGEILATKFYDSTSYDIDQIKIDTTRIHIDADYAEVPVLVNNLSGNMIDFMDMGEVVFPDAFRRTICDLSVEKI